MNRKGETRLAAATKAPARRPQEALLREVLLRQVGWEAALEAPLRVTARRRQYLLKPLARGEGWRVCLCESPPRPALPAYPDRRELHLRTVLEGERSLTVFTDPAGTRQVWAWTRHRAFGIAAYTEEYRASEDGTDLAGIRLPAAVAEPSFDDPDEARAGTEAALGILTRRLRRLPTFARLLGGGAQWSEMGRLQRMIECSRTPEVPRRVWAELQQLRILDPACGSGSWLGGCLLGLGVVAGACLQRMQPWVEDAPPGRTHRYADFRRLVARSQELARAGVRDRLAWEMVLLRCLRGVEEDTAAASRCRRALVAHLSTDEAEVESEALVDIRCGRLGTGLRSSEELAERARREPEVAAVAAAVGEEAEALARAEEQLLRLRLRGAISEAEVGKGRREIERRRRSISDLLIGGLDGKERPPALQPWIEYNGTIRAGGFHLVRGDRSNPPGNTVDGIAD